MYLSKKSKFRVTLLISTVMAGVFSLPQAAQGFDRARQMHAEQQREQAALQAQIHAGGGVIADLIRHKAALADPGAALAHVGPGTITEAVTNASDDLHSAANGMPFANNTQKIDIIRTVEGGGAADNGHKTAIREALGLDPAAPAVDVTNFAGSADDQILAAKAATRGAKIVNLRTHQAALAHPGVALANATALDLALRNASAGVGGVSAAAGMIAGMPGGTVAEKIAALRAIEAIASPGGEDVHKTAIRNALGLNSDAAALMIGSPESLSVTAFIDAAEERLVQAPQAAAHAGTIAGLNTYIAALANPGGALGAGTNVALALNAARVDHGSAVAALPNPPTSTSRRIAAMEAIEGGGAGDVVHKAALRTALGLDPNPLAVNHAAITANVRAFINMAKMGLAINDVPGPNITAKLEAIRTRVLASAHKADGTPNVPPAAPNSTIHQALNHLGL
jgi:hypothetical protein